MKIKNLIYSILALSLLVTAGIAQADSSFQSDSDVRPQGDRGGVIARVLELTDDQKTKIQGINQEQRQLLRLAQLRLQTARASADIAIYDDVLNEADVEAKVREVAAAQAEITRIRMMSEVAVRNVLSPQQLVKFRALRERFAEQRRNAAERRRVNQRQRDQQRRKDMRQKPKTDNPRREKR